MADDFGEAAKLKEEMLSIVSKCVRCRFCFSQCPVYEASDGWVTQGSSGITQSLYYGIKCNRIDEELRDILMRCTTCRSCEILCERIMAGVALVDAIRMGRTLLLEQGISPIKEQQKALESLQVNGNPYGMPASKRTAWAEGLDVTKLKEPVDDIDTLYFVGCTPSYDSRVRNVARSIAAILQHGAVSFGILENEKCSGDTALIMGEVGLFQMLAEDNLDQFKRTMIQSMITTSPHDFNCFLKEYPEQIKPIRVRHYTQLFSELMAQERIPLKGTLEKRVTYHDPCYLGKHNQVYEEPRSVLEAIPGIQLVEMERNRENSLCCGGGGGRMWADFDERQHLAEIRVLDALETGAEILATACPFCLINFEDAVKVLDKENDILVKDISEILLEGVLA
jgi:Fe-S oxidoreductase